MIHTNTKTGLEKLPWSSISGESKAGHIIHPSEAAHDFWLETGPRCRARATNETPPLAAVLYCDCALNHTGQHIFVPHPWYGPCDGFGPNEECSECAKDQFFNEDEWTAWLQSKQFTSNANLENTKILLDKPVQSLTDEIMELASELGEAYDRYCFARNVTSDNEEVRDSSNARAAAEERLRSRLSVIESEFEKLKKEANLWIPRPSISGGSITENIINHSVPYYVIDEDDGN